MKKCQNCGGEVKDTAKFCKHCGSKIEQRPKEIFCEE
ncbi:MAG: zinc-ribbon domain-containing protein, partial [Clostridiales bacterium]|nr:zinc-ribbon domain-containing protein [Clostridiales bacterium]